MSSDNLTKEVTLTGTVTQYTFVTAAGAATTAITDNAYGIAQKGGVSGDVISVVVRGESWLKVDGSGTAIAVNDALMAKASGAGVGAKAAGATAVKQAIAHQAATTNGAHILVEMNGSPKEVVGS